jgi:hypothetical protein
LKLAFWFCRAPKPKCQVCQNILFSGFLPENRWIRLFIDKIKESTYFHAKNLKKGAKFFAICILALILFKTKMSSFQTHFFQVFCLETGRFAYLSIKSTNLPIFRQKT